MLALWSKIIIFHQHRTEFYAKRPTLLSAAAQSQPTIFHRKRLQLIGGHQVFWLHKLLHKIDYTPVI